MSPTSPFTDVPTAIEEFRAGRMVVIVDDEDRENEGDFTLAAEKVTPEIINFMAKYGRGLICLTMTEERLEHLRIGPMTAENTSQHGTAFCEAIDAREGITLASLLTIALARYLLPLTQGPGPPILLAPDTSSLFELARVACWCAQVRLKHPSILRGLREWSPRESSAKS